LSTYFIIRSKARELRNQFRPRMPSAVRGARKRPALDYRYPRTIAAFTESGPPGARDNALDFGIDRILDGLGVLIASRTDRPTTLGVGVLPVGTERWVQKRLLLRP
jgi:hypothetical protein